MFNKKVFCVLLILVLLLPLKLVAQDRIEKEQDAQDRTANDKKFYVLFDEGISYSVISRLILQEEKSNYVFEDYMIGSYMTVRTEYFSPFNPIERLAVYVPFSTEFNNVELERKRFNWSFDSFTGVEFTTDIQKWLFIRFGPGVHFNYEYADRFEYITVGLGGYIDTELPISYRWSIILDGAGTFDFLGNLGSNKYVEYYNYCWQWQTGLGVRYTTKGCNERNYSNQTLEEIEAKQMAKKAKKDAEKQKTADKKASKEKQK